MNWLRQLFTRRAIYDDLAQEIQQHLSEKTESLMAQGMSRAEATSRARREFGNPMRVEERGREAWIWPSVEGTLADCRFALRRLKKSPGFALTAILTLALGIGANVVVFSVLNGLILRPVNVPEPRNLYQISRARGGMDSQSYPDYADFRDRDASFSGILAYRYLSAGLTAGKSAVRSWGYATSSNYFDVLGVEPALGRFFHASDEHGLASAPYMVISDDFWRRQFDSDPSIMGQSVMLNHHSFKVVGVARPGFRGTDLFFSPDYWIPIVNAEQVTGWSDLCCRDHLGIDIMGRLKPGVTPQQATDSLNALATQMAKEDKKDDGLALRLRQPGPAGDEHDPTKKALLGLMLLASLVLLAACANLASIFAARAADRSGELAIRLAIGSSRWNVVRQLFTEAVMVSAVGGLLGSSLAWVLLRSLSHWQPFGDFPTHFLIAPDARVYVVAVVLSIGSGLIFGLLPARQVWRTDVVRAIKSGYLYTESFRGFALRDVLLIVQIVVCTLLVTASLVAVRGMRRALHIPLGFEPQQVTLAQADLRMAGYSGETALRVQKRLLEAASAIPGVISSAIADSVPFLGGSEWFVYRWGTTEFLPSHMVFAADTYVISPGYLQTIKTPLLAGRDFSWHDDDSSPRVAIVNQTFARRLYGDASPIGQRFALWATAKYEVVGVVEDGKYNRIGEDPEPMMLIPLAQGVGEVKSTSTTVIVRSQLPEDQITAALHRALTTVEPIVPFALQPWPDRIDRSMVAARAAAVMLGIMGMLAAMLAVTGIFGMASYSVSKRMREQGIRMALGAHRFQVLRSMLARPVFLLLIGSLTGLVGGVLTGGVLAHLIAFATPREPMILVGVLGVMIVLGLLATLIPARRALGIDPARLLREP
jgi:predicted permease